MTPERKPHSAILRYHTKYVAVLCPNGHYITKVEFGRSHAGSAGAAELGLHSAGYESIFDRLALECSRRDALEVR